MGFNRPSLQTLIERVQGDFQGIPGAFNVLRRSYLGVLSRAVAGLSHLALGHLQFIEKQAFPDTAQDEYLERWASIYGIIRNAATFAEFNATLSGTDGTIIPVGTIFRRQDGTEYSVTQEGVISAGTVEINLISLLSGQAPNVTATDIVSILSPIAGLDSDGVTSTIITEGEDTETDDLLRTRLISKIQNPPSGGAATDYLQWALEVPGVTRSWVLPGNLGAGTVGVSFVEDGQDPIIPSAAKVQEVIDYIELRRPVTANVNVSAPVAFPMNLTIAIKPNTVAVQNAIVEELSDLVRRDASLSGAFAGPLQIFDGKILLSRINESISIASGEADHQIIDINGAPPEDVTPNTSELVVLGGITWQGLA